METVDLNVSATLRNRKFLALLAIALLVTYALPFPLINGPLHDYSRLKRIMERMTKENDAIVCHNVLDTNPDFFGSHGMKCDDEYYRPNESTVTVGDLIVYEDTYNEYLRAREDLKRGLPVFIFFAIFVFLAMLGFGYAMVDFAVGLSAGTERRLQDSLTSGLRAIPALAASEILVLIVLLLVLILLAIPMALLGPFSNVLVGLVASPAFALVVPAYYSTKNIGLIEEIWRVVKKNTGGYFALGAGLVLVDGLMILQYNLGLGIWTLPVMIMIGAVRYPLNSLGALKVYLDTEREEETSNEEKET
ncbi:hypothetical protein [Thermococcus sp. 5-4]|uniref:hypothetical protein n=1 Tax=Thermococcus sp. 5-4 TaxID=2008440 RepID=UPI000B4A340A|nr:hypothetical protein [Thermococcus sp. 5-4]ASA77191.1 hypothetical protein CDI07_02415 [Thermococcus sp. 5-4]